MPPVPGVVRAGRLAGRVHRVRLLPALLLRGRATGRTWIGCLEGVYRVEIDLDGFRRLQRTAAGLRRPAGRPGAAPDVPLRASSAPSSTAATGRCVNPDFLLSGAGSRLHGHGRPAARTTSGSSRPPPRGAPMSVARVTEITSTSESSFDDAIRAGLARAGKTLRNVRSAWVKEQQVRVGDDGGIVDRSTWSTCSTLRRFVLGGLPGPPAPIGLITGTGLYELEGLEQTAGRGRGRRPTARPRSRRGASPGVPVLHVPRHGAGHARLSHQVTARANVAAIAAVGAVALVSTTVCGAVNPSLELGSLVVFDDLHFPSNRLPDGSLCTLFTSPDIPGRGHWISELPLRRAGAGRPAPRRRGRRPHGPRRRHLRPRGRAAAQQRQRDRPARRGGRGGREPDRGPRDRARRGGRPAPSAWSAS